VTEWIDRSLQGASPGRESAAIAWRTSWCYEPVGGVLRFLPRSSSSVPPRRLTMTTLLRKSVTRREEP
jgi:hypothetical protein